MTAVDTAAGPGSTGRRAVLVRLSRAGRPQILTMSGQLVAGVGNLVVSMLFARLLLPGDYAVFVSFLAAYVLIHMVGASVTAAVAIDPSLQQRLFRRGLLIGMGVGAGLAALSTVLSPMLNLPVPVIVLLGVSCPSAVLLALARGRLYGTQRVGGIVATLTVEPFGRGLFGLLLVGLIGPTGAAAGVVVAGYAALLVATLAGRRRRAAGEPAAVVEAGLRRANRESAAVSLAFLLIGVIAAADVIFANRWLEPGQAGLFAAVATIGGAAYFATATIPMVLSGSRDSGRSGLWVAVGVATAVSVGGVAVVAVLPPQVYAAVLGEHYSQIGDYVVYYVAAMAALGIARVLVAQLCKDGRGGVALALAAAAVLAQLAVLIPARSAGMVVAATGLGCAVLLIGSAIAVVVPVRASRAIQSGAAGAPVVAAARVADPVEVRPRRIGPRLAALWPLWLAMAVGVVLRVIVTRSIWVDEAISIQQAQLSYPDMIRTLLYDDVHPPLFHTVLWALVHATGSVAEPIVRLPSLLAGIACIPVSYAMARDLWPERRTAIVVSFVVAIAPVAVWYSQESRMYGMWMLGATILAWNQIRILRDVRSGRGNGSWADWTSFTLITVAMIYLQWFAALPILTQHAIFAVAALRYRRARFIRNWLISGAAQLLLFAPLLPYMLQQFGSIITAQTSNAAPSQTGTDATNASNPDVYAIVANTIWSIWGYHADDTMVQLGAFWPLAVLLCFAALGRVRDRNLMVIMLIGVVPAVLLFMIGFERRQFFELRYFTSTVPMMLLLVGRTASTWGRGPLTKIMLPVVTIATLGIGLVDQQINQSNPRVYDFRGAVSWVKANSQPQDVVLYAPTFLEHELDYYPSGLTTLDASTVRPLEEETGMPDVPDDGRRVFVFGSFLEDPKIAGQVGTVLSELEQAPGTEQVGDPYEAANVKVWEFEQEPVPDDSDQKER